MFEGRIRLPDAKTSEVVRFVWEQERQNGYERPSWPEFLKRWNAKHPEAAFNSFDAFRMDRTRGIRAITELNISLPRPRPSRGASED